ncbi:MAG: GHKL domain-containing protein, partial [candidate division Zixibacteria bacterium]|nr:GHKL domain-containing protein [candidate division Zixibacteria bacterium]
RTISGELPGDVSIYYLEQTSDFEHVIVLVSDALFFSEAKKNIGIGFLVQNIAREVGIEYIIFQTNEGIVFSSKKIGPILKIENDSFLQMALDSDTTVFRRHLLTDREILELIKPFSSLEFGDGIFRLGISLEKYNEIVAGFDQQMIILSIVIFIVLVLFGLYLSGKQKRKDLDRSFIEVKSLSEKVFDSINSGLVIIRKDKTVELANRQFLNDFNIDEQNLLNNNWHELPFNAVVPFDEFLLKNETSGEYKTELSELSDKKYFLINIARLFDYKNQSAGAVAVVYNYSRLKELEDVANRKERLSELGDLAAGVAHEIRNPLNGISIAAQRLMAEFEPKENSEEFQSFTKQIKSEAGRLNDIVTKFLSLARGQEEKKDRIDLGGTINDTLQFLKLDSEKSGAVIKSDIESNISLSGSKDKVKQLIINLVRNSLEACQNIEGQISVSLIKTDNSVILSVTDNGPGIPEDIQKKIFNPYFTTRKEGTGLGLSIVHQIVEEFDGELDLRSSHNNGTEFIIKFPL